MSSFSLLSFASNYEKETFCLIPVEVEKMTVMHFGLDGSAVFKKVLVTLRCTSIVHITKFRQAFLCVFKTSFIGIL